MIGKFTAVSVKDRLMEPYDMMFTSHWSSIWHDRKVHIGERRYTPTNGRSHFHYLVLSLSWCPSDIRPRFTSVL